MVSCGERNINCNNEIILLSAPDTLPHTTLDFSLPAAQLEAQLRGLTSAQNQKKPLHFGLLFNGNALNASIHAAHLIKPACFGMPAMQHRAPQLEVNLIYQNKALLEGKALISLDSIPGYIDWYFPNDKPYGEKIVKLAYQPGLSVKSITKSIQKITEGYQKFYRTQSQLIFNKPICQLTSAELKEVSKKFPFELRLSIGDPPSEQPAVANSQVNIPC